MTREEAMEMSRGQIVRGPKTEARPGLHAEAGENHWGMVIKVIVIVIKTNKQLCCCSMEDE